MVAVISTVLANATIGTLYRRISPSDSISRVRNVPIFGFRRQNQSTAHFAAGQSLAVENQAD